MCVGRMLHLLVQMAHEEFQCGIVCIRKIIDYSVQTQNTHIVVVHLYVCIQKGRLSRHSRQRCSLLTCGV
jgi:hypothetical protein